MRYNYFKKILLSLFVFAICSIDANAQPNFVYTNNDKFGDNSVTAFAVAANGVLTEIPGSPFFTQGIGSGGGFFAANRINVTVVGAFLFVSNNGSNDITAFSINPGTGALTLIPGSPFATGGFAFSGMSLGVTPDNRFLYAVNLDSLDVSIFNIAANGALTPIAGSPFALGIQPDGIKVSPDGRFLSIAFPFIDAVGMYNIGANGALTPAPGSPFPAPPPGLVTGIDINCAGTLLFSGEAASGTSVDVFDIGANGSLTPAPGASFHDPNLGISSQVVLLSPDEKFLFASNQFSGTVTVFNVAANGALTLVPGSPFLTGGEVPSGMATNQAGTLLYVANFNTNDVTVFSIAANGVLTPVPGSPFRTGQLSISGGLLSLVAFPSKNCLPDTCIKDDSNGTILRFNRSSGAYVFTDCRKGITLSGTGRVVESFNNGFCKVELSDSGPDRKRPDRNVSVLVNPCSGGANAQVSIFATGKMYTISDSNIFNNVCNCP
jgi:6-phosphogluconolactonase